MFQLLLHTLQLRFCISRFWRTGCTRRADIFLFLCNRNGHSSAFFSSSSNHYILSFCCCDLERTIKIETHSQNPNDGQTIFIAYYHESYRIKIPRWSRLSHFHFVLDSWVNCRRIVQCDVKFVFIHQAQPIWGHVCDTREINRNGARSAQWLSCPSLNLAKGLVVRMCFSSVIIVIKLKIMALRDCCQRSTQWYGPVKSPL